MGSGSGSRRGRGGPGVGGGRVRDGTHPAVRLAQSFAPLRGAQRLRTAGGRCVRSRASLYTLSCNFFFRLISIDKLHD